MTSAERPDPLRRLDATAEAIGDLRDVFAAEEPLNDVLARVAETAARAIPDADAVSITVLTGDQRSTPASTDERIIALDHLQQVSGRGPCIEAAEGRKPVRVEIATADRRWPDFAEQAAKLGVRASLSAPLLVGDGEPELVGSLNVYSYTASAFDPFDEGLIRLYTVSAGQAITNARRWQKTRDNVTSLERALTSRAEIDQAKGALMAIHGCTPDEAFQRLVSASQDQNIKLHELARQFLASLRRAEE
ncbi:transcriptional regulator [Mycobacterium saskatchewanense]|uniref:Response regulator receiver protein n=1 Tax=Mycobacterium saskatchewanense TaxID=220927 RepID=A0AAJ3TSN9_9MYCO|nr:ANTAR domain-containing protein [Mycobacterium saskatchewanense]ORW64082.1 response regulator receiver protein [Mycobacterium saskatchewanense]BBX62237.1 transcriptional regulator [Mycobacterium saskatchewanense]